MAIAAVVNILFLGIVTIYLRGREIVKKAVFYSIIMLTITLVALLLTRYTYVPILKQQQLLKGINSVTPINPTLEQSPYFDTKQLLNDRQKTTTLLKKDGFFSVSFYSPDGIKLTGLLRFDPQNQGTVICCEGYHVGTRFDAAALTPLIPANYNILYFNQRGYYPSKGRSAKNLWFFGLYHYQDIIGAIQFVNTLSSKPIIVWGTCAGAFNAAHALIKIQEQKLSYPIKGLIFDSGWACVPDTAYHFSKNMVRKFMGVPTISKSDTLVEKITHGLLSFLKKILLIDYCFSKYDNETTLLGKMYTISVPVLFIHSKNDIIAPFEQVQELIIQTSHAFSWIVPESTHSMIHIKQKSQYQQILTQFLDYIHYT